MQIPGHIPELGDVRLGGPLGPLFFKSISCLEVSAAGSWGHCIWRRKGSEEKGEGPDG